MPSTKFRILVATSALLSLAACSKDDDDTPVFTRPRVTPALLPIPSCDDTTDDGKFEVWNSSEDSLMLLAGTIIKPSGTHIPGFMSDIRLQSRHLHLATPIVSWTARFDSAWGHRIGFTLVDQASGAVQAWSEESINGSLTKNPDPQSQQSKLRAGTLTPGCKRLYYHGFHLPAHSHANQLIGTPDTLKVLYRGHFDVEVH